MIIGGETLWQGMSWHYCLGGAWVWWNSWFRNFCSWHVYKCPLTLCSITSCCRHSQHWCFKITRWLFAPIQVTHKDVSEVPHLSLVATRVLMPGCLIFLCVHLQLHFLSCFQTTTDDQIDKYLSAFKWISNGASIFSGLMDSQVTDVELNEVLLYLTNMILLGSNFFSKIGLGFPVQCVGGQ
jgi:hypothetical protein